MSTEEDRALSDDKPPSYVDIHTHAWLMQEDGVIHVCSISPGDAGPGKGLPEYCSAGIHPWKIRPDRVREDLDDLDQLLDSPGIIALGECGMDRCGSVTLDLQEKVFIEQVRLAEKHHLPVIVHGVRCWPEIVKIKKKYAPDSLWAAHGFHGSPETANMLLRHSVLLSFGESIADETSSTRDILKALPGESFLFETDESSLSIDCVYLAGALIRQTDIEELKAEVYRTFLHFCGKD